MRFTESFIEEREWINVSHRGYPYLVRIHIYSTFPALGKNLIDVDSRSVAKNWPPEAGSTPG